MKNCETVLELNKMLWGQGQKYIYLDEDESNADSWGMDIMLLLSQKGIFIDGFVSGRKDYIGAIWCNKEVFNIRNIDKDAFVCTRKNLYTFSPNLRSNIVIYGAGLNGKRVAEMLTVQGKNVICFVDSDLRQFEKKELLGKKINSVDFISDLNQSYSVLLAGRKWKEMLTVVRELNQNVNIFWYEQDSLCEKNVCDWGSFVWFDVLVKNKKIYVYGSNDCTRKFVNLATLMGYRIEAVLIEEEITDAMKGLPVKPLEDVLYESDYFIFVDNKGRRQDYEKLTGLGLRHAVDFSFIRPIDLSLLYERETVLDVNLGNSYGGKSQYPGFAVYGNNSSGDIKIVTLGGSTTDGALYPFKSWPEILYEKCSKKGITVFNGGVAGYNSGQELFKLIRDVLVLKPDIIVEYGAHNDMWLDKNKPYAFTYVRQIFEYTNRCLDTRNDAFFRLLQGVPVCTGIMWNKETPEIWLKNIMMMREISRVNGILFFSFIQPNIFTKKYRNVYEDGLWIYNVGHIREKRLAFDQYIRDNNIVKSYDYIYDLTGLFDNLYDVYIDIAHVNEKANEVIAAAILDALEKVIYYN